MCFHVGLRPGDAIYRLRPETVESLFVLYRVTGDKKYRDWGWELYKNIERECRHPNGYVCIRSLSSSICPLLHLYYICTITLV